MNTWMMGVFIVMTHRERVRTASWELIFIPSFDFWSDYNLKTLKNYNFKSHNKEMLIKRLWKALIMWKYNLSLEILTKKSIEREGGVKGARSKPKTNNYERHNESFIVVKEHYLYRREFCRGVGHMQCKEISEKKNILNIISQRFDIEVIVSCILI